MGRGYAVVIQRVVADIPKRGSSNEQSSSLSARNDTVTRCAMNELSFSSLPPSPHRHNREKGERRERGGRKKPRAVSPRIRPRLARVETSEISSLRWREQSRKSRGNANFPRFRARKTRGERLASDRAASIAIAAAAAAAAALPPQTSIAKWRRPHGKRTRTRVKTRFSRSSGSRVREPPFVVGSLRGEAMRERDKSLCREDGRFSQIRGSYVPLVRSLDKTSNTRSGRGHGIRAIRFLEHSDGSGRSPESRLSLARVPLLPPWKLNRARGT